MDTVTYGVAGGIATITVNRPHVLGALNAQLSAELLAGFRDADSDPAVRVIVLTGSGRGFIAGADLKEALMHDQACFARYVGTGQELARQMLTGAKPSVCAVNGVAVGAGLEIALCCDIRVAATGVRLGFPEVSVGLLHTNASSFLLPRILGLGRTMDLVLTGRLVTAEEARELGLVEYVEPPDQLMARAYELAERIATRAPVAVRHARQLMYRGGAGTLADALELELEWVKRCFATADAREGVQAFSEKRTPEFRGE